MKAPNVDKIHPFSQIFLNICFTPRETVAIVMVLPRRGRWKWNFEASSYESRDIDKTLEKVWQKGIKSYSE